MNRSEIVEWAKQAACPKNDCEYGHLIVDENTECEWCAKRSAVISAQGAEAVALRYTHDGALAECPCCGSLDVGAAGNTAHCYGCGLSITKFSHQEALDAWNKRTGRTAPPAQAASENGPTERQVYEWFQTATIKHHIREDGSHIKARANHIAQQAWKAAQAARVPSDEDLFKAEQLFLEYANQRMLKEGSEEYAAALSAFTTAYKLASTAPTHISNNTVLRDNPGIANETVLVEKPLGAVHNGQCLMARVEAQYGFECIAGPLENCIDWIDLRRCFDAMAEYISSAPGPVEKAPEGWKMVPIKPNNNMRSAASQLFARKPNATPSDYYCAMVDRAPAAPVAGDK